MAFAEDTKNFILTWDIQFPLDRVYRQKHGISFGSEEHMNTCQVGVYMDYIENKMFDEFMVDATKQLEEERKMKEAIKKGQYIKEIVQSPEELDGLFEKLRSSLMNKKN